jgi:hypothetical protein
VKVKRRSISFNQIFIYCQHEQWGMVVCPECGQGDYQRLSQHIAIGQCDWPSISQYKKELLTGMLMGDGCISKRDKVRPNFIVAMTNEEFLQWFSNELEWLSYDVRMSKTGEESAASFEKHPPRECEVVGEFSDVYRMQTMRHPWFNDLASWYSKSGKRYPDDLELTPIMAKMWYVADGGLRNREPNSNVVIACHNESNRSEFLCSLFREHGFDPQYNGQGIVFSISDSKKFLQWIGKPVPGFEYKWQDIDKGGFTPWRDKETLEYLYIECDLSLLEVGELLGCSADTVGAWLRENDLPVKSKGGKLPS